MHRATWDELTPVDGIPVWASRYVMQHDAHTTHSHAFVELAIIFSGQSTHMLNGVISPVRTGDVFIFGEGDVHEFMNCHDLDLGYIMINPQSITQVAQLLQSVSPPDSAITKQAVNPRRLMQGHYWVGHEDLNYLASLLMQLKAECLTRGIGFESLSIALLVQILIVILRSKTGEPVLSGRAMLAVDEVIWEMERRYSERLTLDDLAVLATLSKDQCIRAFKKATGLPPIQYLNRLRIQKAARLLQDTRLSVAEVANAVGFPDSNYFSRQFKKYLGMSPTKYLQHKNMP